MLSNDSARCKNQRIHHSVIRYQSRAQQSTISSYHSFVNVNTTLIKALAIRFTNHINIVPKPLLMFKKSTEQ